MLLITLGVSYLTSVISAVVGKRSFASQVTGFGSTGAEMAAGLATPGTRFPAVVSLSSLSSALTTLGQQHRAYPLLHAYRPRAPELGTAPAVAVLLDAAELDRQGLAVDPERLAEQTAACAELRDGLSRRIAAAGYDWPGTGSS